MPAFKNLIQHLQDRIFHSIVSNRLVYNTCWEDPLIDRQLLNIDENSHIVMLTSGGCNTLDYLLDDPYRIDTVDANPAQNALLELKIALFETGDYELLFELFGNGFHDGFPILYQNHFRRMLSNKSQSFWDRNIDYFNRTSAESSFYFRGTSGKIAWMMHRQIKRKGLFADVLNMLDSRSLQEQRYYFEEIEPELLTGFYRWLLNRSVTMAMLGVPNEQRKLIEHGPNDTLLKFIRSSLKKVFTERPLSDNYFWRVYLTGSYTKNCCPNYLRKENFKDIVDKTRKINTHTCSLVDFLESNPAKYTHYVLLDHQDWLATSDRKLLKNEWRLILQNSRPGTRILFRSASEHSEFLPSFVKRYLKFEEKRCRELHQKDRVGTYGNTFLGIVKNPLIH